MGKKTRALLFILLFSALGLYSIFFIDDQVVLVHAVRLVCFFIVGWNLSILTSKERGI